MVVPRYARRVPELSVFCPLLEPFEPLELFGVSDFGRVAALDIPGAKPGAPCGIPFGGVPMFGPPIPGPPPIPAPGPEPCCCSTVPA